MAGSHDDVTAANAPTDAVTPRETEPTAPRRESLDHLDIGARLGERYVVRELLGEGGMGAVYRVRDETLAEDVALKVVRSSLAELLRDEVRLAQRVTHRNVCRTYDLEDIAGRHFLKMEYIAGEPLSARLARGRLAIAEAVRIARAVADGLAAAHAEAIVHRDLKPANVMLAGDRVVLMDFGLAQRASDRDTDGSGTPGYMSPEQLAGRGVDARSDLYALGCVVFELVAGKRAEQTTDLQAVRADTPRWLARATEDLLALDPERRVRGARLLARGPRSWKPAIAVAVVLATLAVVLWRLWPSPAWQAKIETIGTIHSENADNPVLSPDGRTLAFISDREGIRLWRVFTMPIDGGAETRLLDRSCTSPAWKQDGTAVFASCETDEEPHIFEIPLAGAAPRDRGPGAAVSACGPSAWLVVRTTNAGVALVLRGNDGVEQTVGGSFRAITSLGCDTTGQYMAFVAGNAGELWLVDHGAPRKLVADGVEEVAMAPDARSIVYANRTDQTTDLYELTLADGVVHRLTTGAQARSPNIAKDGSLLVFDEDVTTSELYLYGRNDRVKLTSKVGLFEDPAISPDGRQIVATRDGHQLVLVDIATRAEHDELRGRVPRFMRDGKRLVYVDDDDPRRVLALSLDAPGAHAVELHRFADRVLDIIEAGDGLHVEVADRDQARAWRLDPDGALHDEGVGGLVMPAPDGGWRAISTVVDNGWHVLALVPPGKPLTERTQMVDATAGRPLWLGDHVLAYCTRTRCLRYDVATRTELDSHPLGFGDHQNLLVMPDGNHWLAADTEAHVARKRLVNFSSRPWAP
jgi:dipeptidyl aminopeptidase/acylaminoacyl peptidase/predicted Ser/Thr protein kinase